MPIVIWPCGEAVTLLSVRHFTTIDVEDMDTWRHIPAELELLLSHQWQKLQTLTCQRTAPCCKSQHEAGTWCGSHDGVGRGRTNAPTKIPSCTDAPMRCAITPAAMMNRKISTIPPEIQTPAQPSDRQQAQIQAVSCCGFM